MYARHHAARQPIGKAGETGDVVRQYLKAGVARAGIPLADRKDRMGNGNARFHSIAIANADESRPVATGCRVRFSLEYKSHLPLRNARFLVSIYDMDGTRIFLLDSEAFRELPETLSPTGMVTCTTGPMMVTHGTCYVNIALLRGSETEDHVEYAAIFELLQDEGYGTSGPIGRDWAMCVIDQQWAEADQARHAKSELGSLAQVVEYPFK